MNNDNVEELRKNFELLKQKYKEKKPEELIEKSARGIKIKSDDSNKIMVYCGTYIVEKTFSQNTREYLTYEGNYNATYKLYLDLETSDIYKIKIADCEKFESEYTVINIPVTACNYQEYYKNYNKVRNYFLSEVINDSQEQAVKKLINKKNNSSI